MAILYTSACFDSSTGPIDSAGAQEQGRKIARCRDASLMWLHVTDTRLAS
jgi:hypothetical protein